MMMKKENVLENINMLESSYKDHSEFLSGRRRYASLFKLRKSDYNGLG